MYNAAFQRGSAKANAKEEAPMKAIATTPNPTTLTNQNPKKPQQRQTAKDMIAANVKSLIEQLEAGHSHALTAYLDAMSRFHNYSFGNILEIARQRPDATRVAGLYAWNQLGRKVMKRAERHSHSGPDDRHQAQEGRRGRAKDIANPESLACWLASAMLTSSMWRRPKARSFPTCGR